MDPRVELLGRDGMNSIAKRPKGREGRWKFSCG